MNVLAVARDALETGALCDVCLGRLVADRSFGLANADRGRSLRVAVALADDETFEAHDPAAAADRDTAGDVPVATDDPDTAGDAPVATDDPHTGSCWVCEGETGADAYETWAERAATALRGYEFDTYQVGTSVPPLLEENDRLLREDVGLDPDAGDALKAEFNREVGKRLGAATDAEVDFERPDVQLLLDLATDAVEIQVNSAFVYGRYRKLERDIPQTEWPCTACNETGIKRGEECSECGGTGYRYDESVEELTAPVVRDAMDGDEAVFHGAGREDVDARMLGTGRPFVVEVKSPRERDVDTAALEAEINDFADGNVEVVGLAPATYEMVERVKELEASKRYRMAVAFDEPVAADDLADALDDLEGATIHQDTPQRVDHRRASKTRTRDVYEATGELDDGEGEGENEAGVGESREATVEIHGAGGLYVKELVSGDEGRTEPSLAGLLDVGATVTALDVLAVTGEDDPFEHPDYFRSGVKDIDPPEATDE